MTAEPFPLDPREAVFTVLEAWSSDELVKRLEGRFRLQRGEPLERAEVYLDTPDWRLHRARLALARHVQGRTQELLLSDGDGDAARAPATRRIDFAWELPQGGLRKAVRKAASVRRLLVQAETEVVILPLEVLDDREKTVVRLDMTSARVRGPKETLPLRTTIRVKPLRGYAGERDAVVEFLAGDPALALDAPTKLAAALDAYGQEYQLNEGDGAFYGPKIDLHIRDALNRTWQCGTIQLDMSLPERFNLHYIDKDNERHRPIMIHRTVFGSIERFLGILIEHFAGKFPLWLSPLQAIILPINDDLVPYANEVLATLKQAGLRADVDSRTESLNKKVREAQLQYIPIILTIGGREKEASTLSVRTLDGNVKYGVSHETFINTVQRYFSDRSLSLEF